MLSFACAARNSRSLSAEGFGSDGIDLPQARPGPFILSLERTPDKMHFRRFSELNGPWDKTDADAGRPKRTSHFAYGRQRLRRRSADPAAGTARSKAPVP